MGKDGKSRFFAYNIRHFYLTQKIKITSQIKKFVIKWYQNFILNHKTDFSPRE